MGKGGVEYWRTRAGSAQMEPIPVTEWPQQLLESPGGDFHSVQPVHSVRVAGGAGGANGGAGGGGGTVTTQPRDAVELEAIAGDVAKELVRRIGPGATVIVLLAFERDGHSYPAYAWRGACLSTIGMLDVGANMVRDSMPEEYR